MELQLSKNKLLMEALMALKKLLRDEEALDIAVFRNGRVKSPGVKSGYEDAEFLDGFVSLSTLSLWDTLDQNGNIQVDAVRNAGFKVELNNDSLKSNLSMIFTDSQIENLSDKEKLYTDAIVYTISSELQTPERLIAALQPGPFQKFFNIQSLIKEAFDGLDLTALLKDSVSLEKAIDLRLSSLDTKPDEQCVAEYEPRDLELFSSQKSIDYRQVLESINQQEQRRKEIRQRDLPHFSSLIMELTALAHSTDFLNGFVGKTKLLDKSRLILELLSRTQMSAATGIPNPFPKETRSLENLYHHLIIDALYQTLQSEKENGVKHLIQELKSSEAHALWEKTVSCLAEHFITLCDSMFSFCLGSNLNAENKISLNNAYRLASAIAPEIQNNSLKNKLLEARAEVFLAALMQILITTTLSQKGWGVRNSRYEITIDGKPYKLPRRASEQYEAIQDFMNGKLSAIEAASLVMSIGQKDSSNFITSPGVVVKNYFSLFKEGDRKKTEEEVTEQLTKKNNPG
ncbi:hypothetical protein [Legionella sp. 16cNR16C]|uniref:hypothetical protein n=1 Tax=Legionella sp. 16cNR16C TaxID=2905656 RepID=UPI001E2C2838|nr:hypothetical protein [Legionella sp. 16cNR16C]MCE3045802.1 hypothetical protein [Legionella sp. 16cNR16C]